MGIVRIEEMHAPEASPEEVEEEYYIPTMRESDENVSR